MTINLARPYTVCARSFRFPIALLMVAVSVLVGADPAPVRTTTLEIVKPTWAQDVGFDAYGLYARFTLDRQVVTMRYIRAGSFLMGSPQGDPDELPVHQVTLSPFWMSDGEVSQGLWKAATGRELDDFWVGADRPAAMFTFPQAVAFYAALNARVPGLSATFPTEAQWEYACRADGGVTVPTSVQDREWSRTNSNLQVHPCRTVPPNAWGLYDMNGNVSEWCIDFYGPYASGPQIDPTGPPTGVSRVFRGASWVFDARAIRPTIRQEGSLTLGFGMVGLRLVAPASIKITSTLGGATPTARPPPASPESPSPPPGGTADF